MPPHTGTVNTTGLLAWEQTKNNYKTEKVVKTELPTVAKKIAQNLDKPKTFSSDQADSSRARSD